MGCSVMADDGLKAQIKVQNREKFQKLSSERSYSDKNVVSLVSFPNLSEVFENQ